MISRAFISIEGPPSSGKTSFIEALLRADVGDCTCVRARNVVALKRLQTSSKKTDPELRRFLAAGATAAARLEFPSVDTDAFFMSDVMPGYSEAVLIEGDVPLEHVDLRVFVAPVPSEGAPLLRRVVRDRRAEAAAAMEELKHAATREATLTQLLAATLGSEFAQMAKRSPDLLEAFTSQLVRKIAAAKAGPPDRVETWSIDPEHRGIERAQLVVVNVRSESARVRARAMIGEVARLRKDPDVFRDVMGVLGKKTPVTAVLADVTAGRDVGMKKAVARVKRAIAQVRR